MRKLVHELVKLPTVGEKSAIRLAYHLVNNKHSGEGEQLAEAIRSAVSKISLCPECFALTEGGYCEICEDPHRIRTIICVVEKPSDVIALERCGGYRGLYHVLHGLWSPLKGVGPEKTKIAELLKRLSDNERLSQQKILEVVIATSTTVEGDATALFIASRVTELGIRSSRIAQGLPKGGELEFADDVTLSHAIVGRKSLSA